MILRRFLCPIIAATMAAAVFADGPARTHDISVEDYFSLAVVSHIAASPDGRHVSYVEARWAPPEELRNTELWLVEVESQKIRRLTFDPGADGFPKWAPDGEHLFFLGTRKRGEEQKPPYHGKPQVWVIGLHGGEPFAITREAEGIEAFDLADDASCVYYTLASEHDAAEFPALREQFKGIGYEDGKRRTSTLWKLDLTTWRAEKLVDEKRYIRYFDVSPDKRWIAMITAADDRLVTHEGGSRLDIYDTRTGQIATPPDSPWRAEAPSPHGWLEHLAWRGDSAAAAFTVAFDGYPTEILVAEANAAGDAFSVSRLKRPEGAYVEGKLTWRPGSANLCFAGADRARGRVFEICEVRGGKQGESRVLTPGDVAVSAISFSHGNREPFVAMSTTTNLGDVYAVISDGNGDAAWPYRQLTLVNPHVQTWKLPQIQPVSWTSADGTVVEGVLETPFGHTPEAGPLPMIVELHGGPTSDTKLAMQYWIYGRTLFPAKGYALFSPNYRGSVGYGDKFLTDLIGRENDIEVQDIRTGVDAMIERGVADPKRLGVIGWSNGGFLTNCLITVDDRFKAASSGAGVISQLMQWGEEDTPGHVINFMRGQPWEREEAYMKASPAYRLDRVRAAVLIHVGANDARVPAIHARTLYRGLTYVGVPTQLLTYPDQGHSLATYTHRKAKMEWDLAWFDRYLPGERTDTK